MRKFFILLAASMLCFVSEASSAILVAERVIIGDLYYNLYDNGTAEVVSEFSDFPYNDDHLRGEVIIPSSVQVESATYTVTSIGNSAFLDCNSLTSVTIPNSVTSIGDGAFEGSGITEPVYNAHVFAYLPESYSGHYAIPEGIEQIAGGAFAYCRSLTSVTIPNSVTSIGNYTFYGCESLTSITIPNSVTGIGDSAFEGCKSLTSVTIPNSVTSIGDFAFAGCESLTSITIPHSVTSIGHHAFYKSGITRPVYNIHVFAYLPKSYSGHYAIPQGIEQIAGWAFWGCRSLTSVTIPNSVTSIGDWAFESCESITSVTIPNSVTSIGDYTFAGCENLTSVTIPNSVTNIGDFAFEDCSPKLQITYEE